MSLTPSPIEHRCPHCGQRVVLGMHNHIVACAKLPDDAELAAQYEERGSCKALARKYGVHTTTVQRRLERAGVKLASRGRYNKAGNVDKEIRWLWRRAFKVPYGSQGTCEHCPALGRCHELVFSIGLTLCECPDSSQVARWRGLGLSVSDVIQMSGGWLRENGHG